MARLLCNKWRWCCFSSCCCPSCLFSCCWWNKECFLVHVIQCYVHQGTVCSRGLSSVAIEQAHSTRPGRWAAWVALTKVVDGHVPVRLQQLKFTQQIPFVTNYHLQTSSQEDLLFFSIANWFSLIEQMLTWGWMDAMIFIFLLSPRYAVFSPQGYIFASPSCLNFPFIMPLKYWAVQSLKALNIYGQLKMSVALYSEVVDCPLLLWWLRGPRQPLWATCKAFISISTSSILLLLIFRK